MKNSHPEKGKGGGGIFVPGGGGGSLAGSREEKHRGIEGGEGKGGGLLIKGKKKGMRKTM